MVIERVAQGIRARMSADSFTDEDLARAAIEALAASGLTPKMAEAILGHGVDGWSGDPIPEFMNRARERWSASLRAALSEGPLDSPTATL